MASATSLRRELGLRDITLFAISCIVGTRWISAAAHAGPGSIVLWLIGALMLVAPLAVAVGTLSAKYPSAGGMYVWTRNDFGAWHGFLCFVCYWINIAVWFPSAAMFYAGAAAYTLGPRFAHLANNRVYIVVASLAVIWIALGGAILSVNLSKWKENVGAAASLVLAALLIAVGIMAWGRHGSATPLIFAPVWNWDTVNLLGVIAFAMSGMELVGLMAGEIRDPERNVPRAGWISAVFTVVFYSTTTLAMLVILKPEKIAELDGLAQVGEEAGRLLGAQWLLPAMAGLVVASALGQIGGIGASVSRLPYAAGVDHLLPAAFARLHPRWATPYVSILALGCVASCFLVLLQFGDSIRAAYQSLVSLMVLEGFFPFFYLFGSAWKAGKRVSALLGSVATAVAMLSAVVPTGEIHQVWAFEAKLAAGTFGTVALAWLMYRRKRWPNSTSAVVADQPADSPR